jgi:hypothetical protein
MTLLRMLAFRPVDSQIYMQNAASSPDSGPVRGAGPLPPGKPAGSPDQAAIRAPATNHLLLYRQSGRRRRQRCRQLPQLRPQHL